MSLSLMAFQPAIELPSNMKPSVSMSSSMTPDAIVRCCHLPLGSVNRRSTQSISSSLMRERILPALVAILLPLLRHSRGSGNPVEPWPDNAVWVPAFAGDDELCDSSLVLQ